MKKSLLILLAIVFAFNLNTKAQIFSAIYNEDTIFYNITSSTIPLTVEVTYYYQKYTDIVTIPDSVEYNGNYYKVTSIGDEAFYNNTELISVIFPNSLTSIGNYAFHNCFGLISLTIPNSVTEIGYRAFFYCTGLTSIILPNSISSIDYGTFSYCNSLTSITIPNSVTSIGDKAFYFCTSLTSITLPDSITSIETSAFSDCTALTSITIPNTITSINDFTFAHCSGLTNITIPNSVTSIGELAFCNCIGLTSITIPNSVTSIGFSAFYMCNGLTSIISKAINPPVIQINSFENVNDTIPVYVPCNSIGLYQQDSKWSYFNNFICDLVSVNDIQTNNISTKLYPNPSKGKSKLEIKGLNSEADVLIYDMVGRVIQKHKVNQDTKELEIDLRSSEKGVYFVRIVNNSIKHTKKLIVQ